MTPNSEQLPIKKIEQALAELDTLVEAIAAGSKADESALGKLEQMREERYRSLFTESHFGQ